MKHNDSAKDGLCFVPRELTVTATAELVSGEQHHLLRTIEMLKTMYDYVIVDLATRLDDNMLDVVGAADASLS